MELIHYWESREMPKISVNWLNCSETFWRTLNRKRKNVVNLRITIFRAFAAQ